MSPKLRTRIPPFHGAAGWINSPELSREQLHGAPLLIHFWSIGCAVCKEQLPTLMKWKAELEPRGVRFLGIHSPVEGTPPGTSAEDIAQAANELGLSHPIVIDKVGMVAAHFDARATPAYFVFDAHGELRHYQAGHGADEGTDRALRRVTEEFEALRPTHA